MLLLLLLLLLLHRCRQRDYGAAAAAAAAATATQRCRGTPARLVTWHDPTVAVRHRYSDVAVALRLPRLVCGRRRRGGARCGAFVRLRDATAARTPRIPTATTHGNGNAGAAGGRTATRCLAARDDARRRGARPFDALSRQNRVSRSCRGTRVATNDAACSAAAGRRDVAERRGHRRDDRRRLCGTVIQG